MSEDSENKDVKPIYKLDGSTEPAEPKPEKTEPEKTNPMHVGFGDTEGKPVPVNVPKNVAAKKDDIPEKYRGCELHVFENGDSLLAIAQKYHVAVEQLRYFNGIDKYKPKVKAGKNIYIPTKPIIVPVGK